MGLFRRDNGETEADASHGWAAPTPAANAPRGMTGAGQRLDIGKKSGAPRVDKRAPSAWQTEAWQYFDAIGEVHLAFELLGQILSRIRIFAGVVAQPDRPPVPAYEYADQIEEEAGSSAQHTRKIADEASTLVQNLIDEAEGGQGGMMRDFCINIGVVGEAFLVRVAKQWVVASTDELVKSGEGYKLRRDRRGSRSGGTGIELPKDTFVARLWRQHPRYGGEPDSSMIGILDSCSTLVLLEQAVRVQTRSRLNAGLIFIPEGVTPVGPPNPESGEEPTLETVLNDAATRSADDEGAAITVTPLVVTGPPELGEKIKRIEIGRPVDQVTLDLIDRTLDRIMAGLDIPRDVIAGLAEVKYSNAIIISDDLYRSHVEPLALLICDALTDVYLQPLLKKQLAQAPPEMVDGLPMPPDPFAQEQEAGNRNIAERMVVWFDPSAIVVKADKSQAANEGWDRHIISDDAWRQARGFNEADAPEPAELLRRLALERAPVNPATADIIVEALYPDFFQRLREASQKESGMPAGVQELLGPGGTTPTAQAPAGEPTAMDQATAGGPPSAGGGMPPRPPAAGASGRTPQPGLPPEVRP